MSSSCGEVGLSVGPYLLGSLSRPDRALVDAHLRACAECRADIESMHALPGLLARVRETEISGLVDSSPEMLDRVLSLVAQRRRRATRVHVAASFAAGVILAATTSVTLHRTDRNRCNAG
jgi:predicted anti-sigma-YlaC factor YlaD